MGTSLKKNCIDRWKERGNARSKEIFSLSLIKAGSPWNLCQPKHTFRSNLQVLPDRGVCWLVTHGAVLRFPKVEAPSLIFADEGV